MHEEKPIPVIVDGSHIGNVLKEQEVELMKKLYNDDKLESGIKINVTDTEIDDGFTLPSIIHSAINEALSLADLEESLDELEPYLEDVVDFILSIGCLLSNDDALLNNETIIGTVVLNCSARNEEMLNVMLPCNGIGKVINLAK